MSRHRQARPTESDLRAMLEEILIDAQGDDEQLRAFRRAFEEGVVLPADAFVVGEPLTVVEVAYDGNERRGLTARCRRVDGSQHVVSVADVRFREGGDAFQHVAAYRKCIGLHPFPNDEPPAAGRAKQHKATAYDLDLTGPVDLVVLSVKESAARCRLLGSDRVITLRSGGLWKVFPGEIVTVRPRKQWRYAGHPYLSGDIEGVRLEVAALGLVPLRLEDYGMWDPDEEYWGEEDDPLEEWERTIIARGPRPAYEMEQVLPGADPDDPDTDPIIESNELKDAGDPWGARKMLMEMLAGDLRCLDAHAHLGNLVFDDHPEEALRHYEVGVRIGELSLPEGFDGLLPWGLIDNRPFLRCMHGYGLCLWRLDRFAEAERLFDRILWLNPSDNQGIRFLLPCARAGERWRPEPGRS
jgi:hypothetical protein